MVKDKCSNVITVPQFGGTCWFLAIFMAMFYSQASRTKLLQVSEGWDKRIEIKKIIKHIMQSRFRKTGNVIYDFEYFKAISAETLLSLLHTHDKNMFEFDPTKQEGYQVRRYLKKLYEFFGLETIMIEYDKANKRVYYDFYNSENNVSVERQLEKTPEVLIVNIGHYYREYGDDFSVKNEENAKNILSLADTIQYNGEEYVMDSVVLSNWNRKVGGHAISGITCKKKRYVYNGWTRYTTDPSMSNVAEDNLVEVPCELMKFDWNVNSNSDFCLNQELCKLPKINAEIESTHVCFNFSKGRRNIIYIKKGKKVNVPDHNDCPPGMIRNPITKRWIKIDGDVCKRHKLVKQDISSPAKTASPTKSASPVKSASKAKTPSASPTGTRVRRV